MTPAHLLLVDDSPDVTRLVGVLARRAGHRLSAAADVAQAWQRLTEDRPDLVLLDVNLVGASGLDLLRRLAGQVGRPPVALFCQPELTADLAAGWELGADFAVSKALLGEPARWQERVAEVLAVAGGQALPVCVQWDVETAAPSEQPPSPGWAAALTRALSSPAFRATGGALRAALLRRATAGPGGLSEQDLLSRGYPAGEITRICASLVEQLWRLHGAEAASAGGRALVAEVAPHLRRPGPPRQEARDTMTRSAVILLVEDNPADVKITQRAWKEVARPVELVVTRDGQEAVEYLLRQGEHAARPDWRFPDLVLLDLNLPRMTGRELLERLRATPDLRAVPVVVLTTSRRAEDITGAYAAGANTYIEKPQEFERFVAVLRTVHDYWLGVALLPPLPGQE